MKKIFNKESFEKKPKNILDSDITRYCAKSLSEEIDEIHDGCSVTMEALTEEIDKIQLSDDTIEDD